MGTPTPQEQLQTAMVLANAAEIICCVVNDLLGDNMSTAVNGEIMEGDVLTDTVTAGLQRYLNPFKV
jgi:hypothetical protein